MSSNNWKLTTLGNEVQLLIGYPFKSSLYTEEKDAI